MSAPRRRRGAFQYEPKAGASFDGEVRNHVQDESDENGNVAANLDEDQPAPGAENASFVCTASVVTRQ